jgi:hypothetical protein
VWWPGARGAVNWLAGYFLFISGRKNLFDTQDRQRAQVRVAPVRVDSIGIRDGLGVGVVGSEKEVE